MPKIITVTPNPTFDFAVDADFVEANRKLRCKDPQSHPGGGGINVARAAHRLGADVLSIITTGGPYGDAVKSLLDKERIPHHPIEISGQTRIAFHVHDLSADSEYRFNLPGPVLTEGEVERLLSAIAQAAHEGDFVIGSGSLPNGEPSNFWARAAKVAKDSGAFFVLDSIHGVEDALDEGIFLLRQNKYEYPALAKHELEWPDEIAAFATSLVHDGKATKVSITHGGDGSILASADGIAKSKAFPVKPQSAVGAGDSFVGAMAVALSRKWSDEEAVRYGMSAAAATRMTAGSQLFDADQVEQFFHSN